MPTSYISFSIIIVYPNRSEEDTAILARKEKQDLDEKVKFLLGDSEVKAERWVIMCAYL